MKDCKNRKPLPIPPQGVKMPIELVVLVVVAVGLVILEVII